MRDVTFLETEGYYQTTKTLFREESNSENSFLFDMSYEIESINHNWSHNSSAAGGPDFNTGPTEFTQNCSDLGTNDGTTTGQDYNESPVHFSEPSTIDRSQELAPSKERCREIPKTTLKYYSKRKQRVADSDLNAEVNCRISEKDDNVIHLSPSPQGPSPGDIPKVNELNSVTNQNIGYELPYRSNRGKAPKRFIPDEWNRRSSSYSINNYVSTEHLPEKVRGFAANILAISIPERVEKTLKDEKWTEAMKAEMEALKKNHTWKLVELPKGKKTVGCKWIFSLKYNAKGDIDRYKARLVAEGYT
jgi:Reverse transcriptase (RNA-dependent DNA polymerase)